LKNEIEELSKKCEENNNLKNLIVGLQKEIARAEKKPSFCSSEKSECKIFSIFFYLN